MPEQPEKRRRPLPELHLSEGQTPDSRLPTSPLPYAELHCKTNYSFLEGASHPDELVQRSAELKHAALAITDRNSLAGVVRAHVAAKSAGLKLLIGSEISPCDAPRAVLLATDRPAYGRLSRLITVGRRRAPKGECLLNLDDLAQHSEGLLALVVAASNPDDLVRYREIFGDRAYALAELSRGPDDARQLQAMVARAAQAGVPLAAANDVHYHVADRRPLHDCLTAIRLGVTVAEAGAHRFPNAERILKSPEEMARRFALAPGAVERTIVIASRCRFSLDELRYEYPEELCPAGMTPGEHLAKLAWQGAEGRYPDGIPEKVRQLVEHELALIADLKYEAYFLTVWDLVRFARSRDILCQGRGSAANSAVCYCLGVTSVDPKRIDVLFERFISKERNEAPDIDVDFEHERREEVLQYLYDKYGRERAGMTAEVICYRPRSAIRDIGKAMGLSLDRINALTRSFDGRGPGESFPLRFREAGVDPQTPLARRVIALAQQLIDFPRHLSQHVGGMVITRGPLCELAPIENAAMPDRTVVQWDKDDLDALGILKVDCLALGMLTAIRKCFDMVKQNTNVPLTLATVPPEDPAVYQMIQAADTMGVFQIESRAQMSMLPRLMPKCFYDLVVEVAIVRPGPIQGDMVHPYLRRRAGEEEVDYPNDAIRAVLEKTLGVPIFQEQAMRLAVVAAGFSPGEADQLRRAMGAWRRPGIIEQFRQKLIAGMRANGLSDDYGERVFRQLQGFGEYGFPESHAASFALLVYVSCWLKRYHPAAFAAALLNSQPMGFYAPAQLVRNAREHGVDILPIDIHRSDWDCTIVPAASKDPAFISPLTKGGLKGVAGQTTLFAADAPDKDILWSTTPYSPPSQGGRGVLTDEAVASKPPLYGLGGPALRLGFRMISGLSEEHAATIVRCRKYGPFLSIDDFARRTKLRKPVIARLAKADVFGSLKVDRRSALWDALAQEEELPLFRGLQFSEPAERAVGLPTMTPQEEMLADYRSAGLSLKAHPMEFWRSKLDQLRATPASELSTLR